MSLKTELDAFRADFVAKASPEVREAMARADMELAASGILQRALKDGDRAPDFHLPDVHGGSVRLNDLLAERSSRIELLARGVVPILQSGTAGLAESAARNHKAWRDLSSDARREPFDSGKE
jgi:hypothetical protein